MRVRSRAVILRISALRSNDVNVGRNVIFPFSKSGREKTKIKALQSGLIKGKDPLCAARLRNDYMRKEQGAEIIFLLWFRLIYVFENCGINGMRCKNSTEYIDKKNFFPMDFSSFHNFKINIKIFHYLLKNNENSFKLSYKIEEKHFRFLCRCNKKNNNQIYYKLDS